jgi:hypothetical protein
VEEYIAKECKREHQEINKENMQMPQTEPLKTEERGLKQREFENQIWQDRRQRTRLIGSGKAGLIGNTTRMQSLITRENLSPESPWLPTRTRRTTPHGA